MLNIPWPMDPNTTLSVTFKLPVPKTPTAVLNPLWKEHLEILEGFTSLTVPVATKANENLGSYSSVNPSCPVW